MQPYHPLQELGHISIDSQLGILPCVGQGRPCACTQPPLLPEAFLLQPLYEERCSALEQSSGPQLTSSPPSLVVLISTGAKTRLWEGRS